MRAIRARKWPLRMPRSGAPRPGSPRRVGNGPRTSRAFWPIAWRHHARSSSAAVALCAHPAVAGRHDNGAVARPSDPPRRAPRRLTRHGRRPRLALVTPWPPDRTGVAVYSMRLARALLSESTSRSSSPTPSSASPSRSTPASAWWARRSSGPRRGARDPIACSTAWATRVSTSTSTSCCASSAARFSCMTRQLHRLLRLLRRPAAPRRPARAPVERCARTTGSGSRPRSWRAHHSAGVDARNSGSI